jgi:hypothetical protein
MQWCVTILFLFEEKITEKSEAVCHLLFALASTFILSVDYDDSVKKCTDFLDVAD